MKILIDGKTVIFKCDKRRKECSGICKIRRDYHCEHTTELEHAVWDGEKRFTADYVEL